METCLDSALPKSDEPPALLHEAMRYALFSPGKRLRPALVAASCMALGGDFFRAISIGCAFEMIHGYSLVHDDLPCMDDDDFRRGRPTCHKKYGETLALLVGDALQTAAFALVSKAEPEICADLVAVLARVSGSLGMVGGQVLDLEGEGEAPTKAKVKAIHLRKTAALISGSLEAGAILAGVKKETVKAFAKMGELMGLAFQIKDDLLDETADKATLGKTPGKDKEAGKLTWVACVGLQASQAEAEGLLDEALAILNKFSVKDSILADLTGYVASRNS